MRVMYVEGAGSWLSGVGKTSGRWSLKLLREAKQSIHVPISHALVSVGVVVGGRSAM